MSNVIESAKGVSDVGEEMTDEQYQIQLFEDLLDRMVARGGTEPDPDSEDRQEREDAERLQDIRMAKLRYERMENARKASKREKKTISSHLHDAVVCCARVCKGYLETDQAVIVPNETWEMLDDLMWLTEELNNLIFPEVAFQKLQ